MAYATVAELTAWMGKDSTSNPMQADQLSDKIYPYENVDTTVLQTSLDNTGSVINSYLANRYSFPIVLTSDAAPALRLVNMQLAAFDLWTSHPGDREIPDRVKLMYKAAMDWLENVGKGLANVPGLSPFGSGTSSYGGFERVFTQSMTERV